MKQTRTISFIESLLNIASGWIISTLLWMTIGPMFGYIVPVVSAMGFASVFTVTSIVRSYAWRRWFENTLNQWLHQWLHGGKDD